MSFLTIPGQEGLFTATKNSKSADEAERTSSVCDQDDDEEEDDEEVSVRFIPRCSPVPRRRGQSIYEETAEYMRIHQAFCAEKRVSFADTTGGDLVDVKEFVAFDSDDEETGARWEEEEAKYRQPEREPTYQVRPEFSAPGAADLLQAVRKNKVEVEQLSPLENDPLAFSGLIRVLNVSFQKAVYIRSTMDNWMTYFDYPAEYVEGSHDGETDQFTIRLSFAPPYITHGSRIEFVVRYETSEGDFWANNSCMNYVVTLLVPQEEDSAQRSVDLQKIKGILRAPKVDSANNDLDSEEELEMFEEAEPSPIKVVRPTPVCPVIVQPEIDIEVAVNPSVPSAPSNQELPSVDSAPSTFTVSPGGPLLHASSGFTPQTHSAFVPLTSESIKPKQELLPKLKCESGDGRQPINSGPSALLASPPQEFRPISDSSQTGGAEIFSSEASPVRLPTPPSNPCPAGEDRPSETQVYLTCLEQTTVTVPGAAQGFERGGERRLGEPVAVVLSETSTSSAAHCEESPDIQASLGAGGESPPSPELTETVSVGTAVTEASLNLAPQSTSGSGEEEEEDAGRISPVTLLENPSHTQSKAPEPQPELGVNINLMPSFAFMSGVLLLSIALQEPSTLYFIGLLLVLHQL